MNRPNDHDNRPNGNGPGPAGSGGAHLTDEQLSEFIDGNLTGNERGIVEAHLAGCPECHRDLQALQGVVDLMQRLPEPRPRRSFQLSPEQAATQDSWWQRVSRNLIPAMPALRAGAVAIVLLVAAVVLRDVLQDRHSTVNDLDQGQPALVVTTAQPTTGIVNSAAIAANQQTAIPTRTVAASQPTSRPSQPAALQTQTPLPMAKTAPTQTRSSNTAAQSAGDTTIDSESPGEAADDGFAADSATSDNADTSSAVISDGASDTTDSEESTSSGSTLPSQAPDAEAATGGGSGGAGNAAAAAPAPTATGEPASLFIAGNADDASSPVSASPIASPVAVASPISDTSNPAGTEYTGDPALELWLLASILLCCVTGILLRARFQRRA